MVSALEKARSNPNSMKARILNTARKVFGEYGYHGTTTRIVAKEAGIDISTLYYHWGEKKDLYEAVILDITEGMRTKLVELEKKVKDLTLDRRMEIAIDEMTDYLFAHPEISNLTIFRYFTKTRKETDLDFRVPEFIADIAVSMGLAKSKDTVQPASIMQILAIINSIHNFVSGESFFLPMLGIDHESYVRHTKDTLKFYTLYAFAADRRP